MTSKNLEKEELTLKEMKDVLRKFEPGEILHEFRNTAIYRSFRYCYESAQKSQNPQSSMKS
jgi:hypothetical protein